jgi:hypothetical protein
MPYNDDIQITNDMHDAYPVWHTIHYPINTDDLKWKSKFQTNDVWYKKPKVEKIYNRQDKSSPTTKPNLPTQLQAFFNGGGPLLFLLFILKTQAVPTNAHVKDHAAWHCKLHNIKSQHTFSL